MKKDKPRESESEKLQRRQAKIFFDKGTAVKRVVGKDFVRDMKRNPRSKQAAMSSADSAISGRKAIDAKRRGKKINIADASTLNEEISLASQSASGLSKGRELVAGAGRSAQAANNAMNSVRAMSSLAHSKDMARISDKYERNSASAQALASVGNYYLDKRDQDQRAIEEAAKKEEHLRRMNEIFNGGG